MPGHHGVRLDEEQGIRPVGPPTAERHPKQPIQVSYSRPRLFAFEHGELLAKSGGLQTEAVPREEERAKVGDYCKNEGDITPIVGERVLLSRILNRLILCKYEILMTYRSKLRLSRAPSTCSSLPRPTTRPSHPGTYGRLVSELRSVPEPLHCCASLPRSRAVRYRRGPRQWSLPY
jgi:hypothetical protein